MNASSYRGGVIPFLRLFSISFVPFPFHYDECFFVHQFGKGDRGGNKAAIAKYIREQEAEDMVMDQLSFKEYEDPFKKEKK